MIISVCVILGFKHTIRDKVIGFGSHVSVGNFMTIHGLDQYPIVMAITVPPVEDTVPGCGMCRNTP